MTGEPPEDTPPRSRWARGWSLANRYAIQILGLVVLGLTGFTAVLSIQQGANTRRVAEEGRQVASTVNRIQIEALCPLFGLILAAYHPERQPPELLADYNESFDQLRRMNAVLACPT